MDTTTTKGFWDRPEGKTGMIFLALILAGVGYAAFLLLPFILTMLQTAVQTAILAGVLGLVGVLAADNKFRLRVKALYQIGMKWLTSWIVELDPIAIIEGYLGTLEESLGKMNDQLNLLKGQESKLNTKILSNRGEITKNLDRAAREKANLSNLDPQTAEYINMRSAAALDANKAARLTASNQKLEEVLSKIANLRKVLEKMHVSAKYVLADMTDEVKVKKEEREAVLKGYSAFKSAMKVLDGNKDEKALFDESMEFMATDLGNKVGEIERFMENSGSILTSMDVDNEMFNDKGMLLIDEWTKKGDQLFISSPKEKLVQPVTLSSNSFINNNSSSVTNKYL